MNFSPLIDLIDRLIEQGMTPGIDCLVKYKGSEVFRYTSGLADIENGIPLSQNVIYRVYSCSKVVTCAAALRLFEEGWFLLNDPLYEYIPEYMEMQVREPSGELRPAKRPITIRDIFCMTAGFSYDLKQQFIYDEKKRTGGRCPTLQMIRAMAGEPLDFDPGERWQYSLCHDVVGALIEAITGKTLGQYLQEVVFSPIGMNDTYFTLPENKKDRLIPQYMYNHDFKKPERMPEYNEFVLGSDYESGGAGLFSTVDDFIRFTETLTNRGLAKSGYRFLAEKTIDLMRTPVLGNEYFINAGWTAVNGYGYGLGVRTMVDPAAGSSLSSIGEFGWSGATATYLLSDPDAGLSIFLGQHQRAGFSNYVSTRIRNTSYACLDR